MIRSRRAIVIVCAVFFATAATAAEKGGWAVSAGVFNLDKGNESIELGLEHRFRPFALDLGEHAALKPVVGLAGHEDGGFWGYAGLRLDWWPTPRVVLTPSWAVALFEEGDGKDLGGPVEFRSGFELAFRLPGGSRLGVVFYHLSNADIYDRNPGSNSLALVWSMGR